MTRVLSALALLPIVVGVIWFLPPLGTVILAEVVLLLAFVEYSDLSARAGAPFPRVTTGAATLATCASFSVIGLAPLTLPVVLMAGRSSSLWCSSLSGAPHGVLASVSAATFALLYLAVPLGSVAALRVTMGPEVVLLLLFTVMTSDTAQYYGGGWSAAAPWPLWSVRRKRWRELCSVLPLAFSWCGWLAAGGWSMSHQPRECF